MFSKIILAALCSTVVSASPAPQVPEVKPIKVLAGCANLWVNP